MCIVLGDTSCNTNEVYVKITKKTLTWATEESFKIMDSTGVTTYYKVKALCATSNYGDSALSNARYITCDCAAPVVAISINVSYNKPMISWDAVDGA